MLRHANNACAIVVVATLGVSLWTYITETTVLGTIGGFTVHTIDVLFLLIVGASLTGLKNQNSHSHLEIMLVLLSGLLLLNFFRGEIQVGSSAAGITFRMYTVFTGSIIFVYVWGRRLDCSWAFERIIWFGVGIGILGVARLILGVRAFILDNTFVDLEPRIFSAPAALILGQASLVALHMSLTRQRSGSLWNALAFAFCFAMVIISDQRTATFATITGLVALLAFKPRRQTTTFMCAGAFACTAGIGFLVLPALASQNLIQYLPHSIQMVVLQEGSFGWRLDQWDIYFRAYADGSLLSKVLGQPFGVLRVIGLGFSTLTDLDPLVLPAHSGYLQLLLNVGAIGLLIFVSLLVLAFAQAIAVSIEHPHSHPLVGLAAAILVSQTVYAFTYSPDNEQGLLLALAIQTIARARLSGDRVHMIRRELTRLRDSFGSDGRQFPMHRN